MLLRNFKAWDICYNSDNQTYGGNLTPAKPKYLAERRKARRFNAIDGSYTVFDPNSAKLCNIIDISAGGLSFILKDNKPFPDEHVEIAILFKDSKINLDEIPFKFQTKIISDLAVSKGLPFKFGSKRRCSMEFKKLSYYQIFWINYFIKHHTSATSNEISLLHHKSSQPEFKEHKIAS